MFILPTIRINNVQYRGKLATAEVLRAICAGFAAGNTPEACSKVTRCPQRSAAQHPVNPPSGAQLAQQMLVPATQRSAACSGAPVPDVSPLVGHWVGGGR